MISFGIAALYLWGALCYTGHQQKRKQHPIGDLATRIKLFWRKERAQKSRLRERENEVGSYTIDERNELIAFGIVFEGYNVRDQLLIT